MESIKTKVKTRDLSVFQFFELLQLEYIVLELRKKIYPSLSDQSYYERVMKQKREKIEDIGAKNYLPSIFSDQEVKKHKYNQIYNQFGLPNFIYKDEEQKQKYSLLDKKYYYLPESEVRIMIDADFKIGKIISVDFNKDKSIVIVEGEKFEVDLEHIGRIL
jgi:hypothetical protein